jgi:hypothetical protein
MAVALSSRSTPKLAQSSLTSNSPPAPESFRLESGTPRIFVNVPKADHIAVVDRDKGEVTATWPLKEAKSNFPLFLDEANHRLFTGPRNPARLLVYDYAAGRQVSSLPISRDTDDLFFDSSPKFSTSPAARVPFMSSAKPTRTTTPPPTPSPPPPARAPLSSCPNSKSSALRSPIAAASPPKSAFTHQIESLTASPRPV